ncbi:hypothetical protein BCR41DRAFT_427053 [Lobosporangium transversale]|uniref:t-SNARE coiled-coil homology domain-containing protein n=1 Tax=Lobosporangium transversale TaxID=64571 RepID=A0A1Y2G124_9FUNG|nr:hypothetical protein BCR41DRAFT_427053 [Lobosporangium transversale]ORY90609.1 hypothetical protein BCR41DRAFT_427053 [Lobosporangium transversale]|eukprot:XP_021875104.1 hypothetical protein BCR41DRAFT_427053 [Lobosporangium transversale]
MAYRFACRAEQDGSLLWVHLYGSDHLSLGSMIAPGKLIEIVRAMVCKHETFGPIIRVIPASGSAWNIQPRFYFTERKEKKSRFNGVVGPRKNNHQTRAELFGSPSSHSNSYNREQQTALLFEQQNDLRMEELASKVSALNKITVDIHNEVHGQHAILDQNTNSFNNFGTTFAGTMKKLNTMASQQLGKSMCFMVSAIVIIFFIVYFILSRMNST